MSKKVQMLFAEDIRKANIKPLSDKELTELLRKAKYSEDEKERREARQKIILAILPIIISKCKKYFREDFIIENTDFINEVILYLLESGIDNYRLEEQEGDRCAMFFTLVNFAILLAYRKLKQRFFGNPDIKLPVFWNPLAKEFQDIVYQEMSDLNYQIRKYYSNLKRRQKFYSEEDEIDIFEELLLETEEEENLDQILYKTGETIFSEIEYKKEFYQTILPKLPLLTNLLYFLENPLLNINSTIPKYKEDYKYTSLFSYIDKEELRQKFQKQQIFQFFNQIITTNS